MGQISPLFYRFPMQNGEGRFNSIFMQNYCEIDDFNLSESHFYVYFQQNFVEITLSKFSNTRIGFLENN